MKRVLVTAVIALAQLALAGVAVAPQLSARLTGDTYLMRVAPARPVDPFRGAYVALDYPDLRHDNGGFAGSPAWARSTTGRRATSTSPSSRRTGCGSPTTGSATVPTTVPTSPATTGRGRSGAASRACSCPRTRARETEALLRDGAVAEVRIDGRGNAAVVDVRVAT